MSDQYQQRAEKVIAYFIERLDDSARANISDAQFRELALMIREALAETLEEAAERIEVVAKGLRAEAEKHELGL